MTTNPVLTTRPLMPPPKSLAELVLELPIGAVILAVIKRDGTVQNALIRTGTDGWVTTLRSGDASRYLSNERAGQWAEESQAYGYSLLVVEGAKR